MKWQSVCAAPHHRRLRHAGQARRETEMRFRGRLILVGKIGPPTTQSIMGGLEWTGMGEEGGGARDYRPCEMLASLSLQKFPGEEEIQKRSGPRSGRA